MSNTSNLLATLAADTFDDPEYADCEVHIEERVFKVNKMILKLHSDVFLACFRHDSIERQTGIIKITDSTVQLVELMLRFMYTGKVESLDEISYDLFILADKYNVIELKKLCAQSMCSNLQIETIFNCLDVAYRLNAGELKQKCLQYLADNNERIQDQPEWISMTDKEPQIARDLCKHHQETLRQKEKKITELEARLERRDRDPMRDSAEALAERQREAAENEQIVRRYFEGARRHMREQLEQMNRRLRNMQEAREAFNNAPPPIAFQQPLPPRIEPIRVFIDNDDVRRRRRERLRDLVNDAAPLLQEVPQEAIPVPNADDPNPPPLPEEGNNEADRDRRRHHNFIMDLEQHQQRLEAQRAHREDLVRQLGEVRQGLGELLQNNVIRRHRLQEAEQQRFQALEENVGHINEPGPAPVDDQPNNAAVEEPNAHPRRRRGEHAVEAPAAQRRRVGHGIRINVDEDIAEQARRNRPGRQIEVVDLDADEPPAANEPARERRRGRRHQNRND